MNIPEKDSKLKVGVAADKWKTKLFKKRLKEAGFTFEKKDGLTPDTVVFVVETDDPERLAEVVSAMNQEAQRSKLH